MQQTATPNAPVAQTEEHLLSKEVVLVQLHSGADEIHRSHHVPNDHMLLSYVISQKMCHTFSRHDAYNLSSEIDL